MTPIREQCIEVWAHVLTGIACPSGCARPVLSFEPCRSGFHLPEFGILRRESLATEYLGRLIQANGGATIEEIVRAAYDAIPEPEDKDPRWSAEMSEEEVRAEIERVRRFEIEAFAPKLFAAIITEALAKGRKGTEMICPSCRVERADYEGPSKHLPKCPNCRSELAPKDSRAGSWFERYGIVPFSIGAPCCGHVRKVHVDDAISWCRQCQSEHTFAEPQPFDIPPFTITSDANEETQS